LNDPQTIIRAIIELQKQFNVLVQVDVEGDHQSMSSEWEPLYIPTKGYAETVKGGPFRVADLHAARINPIERLRVGKHAAVQTIDHTLLIQSTLKEHGIDASIEHDGILTIQID